jgi:hypothetical protein
VQGPRGERKVSRPFYQGDQAPCAMRTDARAAGCWKIHDHGDTKESGDNSVAVDGFAFRKGTDLVPSDQSRGRQQDEDPDKRGD